MITQVHKHPKYTYCVPHTTNDQYSFCSLYIVKLLLDYYLSFIFVGIRKIKVYKCVSTYFFEQKFYSANFLEATISHLPYTVTKLSEISRKHNVWISEHICFISSSREVWAQLVNGCLHTLFTSLLGYTTHQSLERCQVQVPF